MSHTKNILEKLFGKQKKDEPVEEQLVPVPIPALVTLLIAREKNKAQPLTEAEVLDIRDNMVCVVLKVSRIKDLEINRGYADLDPENVWAEWQNFRDWYYAEDS